HAERAGERGVARIERCRSRERGLRLRPGATLEAQHPEITPGLDVARIERGGPHVEPFRLRRVALRGAQAREHAVPASPVRLKPDRFSIVLVREVESVRGAVLLADTRVDDVVVARDGQRALEERDRVAPVADLPPGDRREARYHYEPSDHEEPARA